MSDEDLPGRKDPEAPDPGLPGTNRPKDPTNEDDSRMAAPPKVEDDGESEEETNIKSE